MNVLGIETSSSRGGVALACDGKVLAGADLPEKRHHAQVIFSAIERCLSEASLELAALEGVAVSAGPGSFTGLRVGMACAKGLAWSLGLPVACVRTLAALMRDLSARPRADTHRQADGRAKLACVTRAFQGKVYALVGPAGDEVLPPEELAERLEPGTVLFGDGAAAYAGLFGAFEVHPEPSAPRASTVALMGEEMLLHGEGKAPEKAFPRYLLKTEAERRLEREVG